VVGTAVVVAGATGAHELYKERKKKKKAQAKQWKKAFYAAHPECKRRKFPKVPKKVGPQLDLSGMEGYCIGLGWDSEEPTNADLVALAFDKHGNVIGGVSGLEGNQLFESPAMIHSGDCREGGKESRERGHYDDNENIILNFDALPEELTTIIIGVKYDCENGKNVNQDFKDSYVNGLPIYQFMSSEEFILQKQALEEKERALKNNFIDLRKKEDSEPVEPVEPEIQRDEMSEESDDDSEVTTGEKEEPELPEEEAPVHSFTCSIGDLAEYSAFIPGKFAKLNGKWTYQPIRVPVSVPSIDEFEKAMRPFTPSSVAIPKWGSRPFTVTPESWSPNDFHIRVISFDRWNNSTVGDYNGSVTPAFDTFLVFTAKQEKKPFKYVLAKADDPTKNISCENDVCEESQILCRISRCRAYQRGDYQLPYSKDCYLEFLHKPIAETTEISQVNYIRETFSIPDPVSFLKVTVNRGYDLAAKDLNGKSDPYVKVTSSNKKVSGSAKSKTVKADLNPSWGFDFTMETAVADATKLKLTVWDKDTLSDDKIGYYSLNINKISIPFEEPVLLKGKGRCGAISLKVEPSKASDKKNHFKLK